MRLGLAPLNPTVGDVAGNARMIEGVIAAARSRRVDLLVLPELAVCGYPPRDLLLRSGFVASCEAAADAVGTSATAGITVVIGCPVRVGRGKGVANAAIIYRDNARVETYEKRLLPTYDVFDEDRYFEAGDRPVSIAAGGWNAGLAICEDLWKGEDAGFAGWYHDRPDPVAEVARGCHLIVAPSASPFVMGKAVLHRDVLRSHARRHRVYVASVNQSGANDDLVFDGHAVLIGPDGETIAAGAGFCDDLVVVDTDATRLGDVADPVASGEPAWLLFEALRTGVADYVRKSGFRGVLIGLSGGIDSALTAAIAVAALGPARVRGVSMPGVYSSEHSRTDAADLADRLGIRMLTLGIEPAREGFAGTLNAGFAELGLAPLGGVNPDVADQNLQSRVRGTLMMALSNRGGDLVLTTGNKSELAVGYCTLYGDMNGGLAVLSDVPKTWVWRLARWINASAERCGFARPPIPEASIEKRPSAELAPGQFDSDTLPEYEELDAIIAAYVDARLDVSGVVAATGSPTKTVARVCALIDRNEYKRHQAALGLKVSAVAFGRGRRMPIARG